jgi:hypothetical protein
MKHWSMAISSEGLGTKNYCAGEDQKQIIRLMDTYLYNENCRDSLVPNETMFWNCEEKREVDNSEGTHLKVLFWRGLRKATTIFGKIQPRQRHEPTGLRLRYIVQDTIPGLAKLQETRNWKLRSGDQQSWSSFLSEVSMVFPNRSVILKRCLKPDDYWLHVYTYVPFHCCSIILSFDLTYWKLLKALWSEPRNRGGGEGIKLIVTMKYCAFR